MSDATGRTALIAGATGLVGRSTLARLLAAGAFDRVIVLTRLPLPAGLRAEDRAGRLDARVVPFDTLEGVALGGRVDVAISALGTTIGQAGSQAAFRAVDFDYVLAFARLALAHGARHFGLVSALGADAGSRVFYNRVKGEADDAVAALPFPGVTVLRPSLLLGERSEFRLGEAVAKKLAWALPPKYRAIKADTVAAALVREAVAAPEGRRVVESREIAGVAEPA